MARAAKWTKLNMIIKKLRSKKVLGDGVDALITTSATLAEEHEKAIGVGARMDSEYSCRSRLANTVSPPAHGSTAYCSSLLAHMVEGNKENSAVSDPVILVSLVPSILGALKCSYEQCWLIVTRMEPKGVISCVIDGAEMAKRARDMDTIIDKIATHLGSNQSDPRRWWAARRERNQEIIDLYSKSIPDAFYVALPLLTFAKTPNMDAFQKHVDGFVLPQGTLVFFISSLLWASNYSNIRK